MTHSFVKGASSLFLIASAVKAFYVSKLILWKISTAIIVPVSYFCNSCDYKKSYLMLDYVMITAVSASYLNNFLLNSLIAVAASFEYYVYDTIDTIKNVTYALGTIKAVYMTYYYSDKFHFYLILLSSLSGVSIYRIRYSLIQANNKQYNLLLTYLMHICAVNIMYVSSITAV